MPKEGHKSVTEFFFKKNLSLNLFFFFFSNSLRHFLVYFLCTRVAPLNVFSITLLILKKKNNYVSEKVVSYLWILLEWVISWGH